MTKRTKLRQLRTGYLPALEAELQAAGIEYDVTMGGKHPRINFTIDGKPVNFPMPLGSPSAVRGRQNAVAAIRRIIRGVLPTSGHRWG